MIITTRSSKLSRYSKYCPGSIDKRQSSHPHRLYRLYRWQQPKVHLTQYFLSSYPISADMRHFILLGSLGPRALHLHLPSPDMYIPRQHRHQRRSPQGWKLLPIDPVLHVSSDAVRSKSDMYMQIDVLVLLLVLFADRETFSFCLILFDMPGLDRLFPS